MNTMLSYSNINSPIHKLTGASKLIALACWAIASMITYDTRILIGMFIISIIVFKISKVEFKRTGPKFESLSPPFPPREVTFLGIGYLPNISESQ